MCEDITDEEGKAPPGGGEGGDLGVLAYLCVCWVGKGALACWKRELLVFTV